MTLTQQLEADILELGLVAASGLLWEAGPGDIAHQSITFWAQAAIDRARRATARALPVGIDEAEMNHPDIMWCHWCDAWRETGIDGGGTLHRRCVECGHEIRCDDCSQRVSAEGWCRTKGCPQNPIYSP